MKVKNLKLKIEGMHCSSCAMDIDGTLEDTDGVLSVNTNYAKSKTEVQFDEEKIKSKKIIEILKSLEYDAIPQ